MKKTFYWILIMMCQACFEKRTTGTSKEIIRTQGYREVCLSLGGQGIYPINPNFHIESDKDSTLLEYRIIATEIPKIDLETEAYFVDTIIVTSHVVRTWKHGKSEYWVSSMKYTPFKKSMIPKP